MRNAPFSLAIMICAAAIAACSITVPSQMTLSNPNKRKTIDEPGTNIDSQRFACADRMLNLSPAVKAVDIETRVLSKDDPTIIEVDALLKNVGSSDHDLAVSYHCEYLGGALTLGKWTRGITSGSK